MIDLKCLKSTQKLAGSPLSGEKLPVQSTLESSEFVSCWADPSLFAGSIKDLLNTWLIHRLPESQEGIITKS